MEHRFGQRIRRRELPELRLEVDRSPTPLRPPVRKEKPRRSVGRASGCGDTCEAISSSYIRTLQSLHNLCNA
jgi:hypothetical protein